MNKNGRKCRPSEVISMPDGSIGLKLTRGKVAIIDKADSHLADWKWTCNGGGYAIRDSFGYNAFLHHAIIGRPINGFVADHIDGNTLNNKRNNLRIVSIRENTMNNSMKRNGTTSSRFVGVTWEKRRKNWKAAIYIGGKSIHLGVFKKEEDAANVYQKALTKAQAVLEKK